MLALHLHQSALAHVNTLLLQDILSEEKWRDRPRKRASWSRSRRRCPRPTTRHRERRRWR